MGTDKGEGIGGLEVNPRKPRDFVMVTTINVTSLENASALRRAFFGCSFPYRLGETLGHGILELGAARAPKLEAIRYRISRHRFL